MWLNNNLSKIRIRLTIWIPPEPLYHVTTAHCTWLERFQHTHMYSRMQTIVSHKGSITQVVWGLGKPFIGGDQINIENVWSMCYASLILIFLFVKNKYMFVTGNLKITRKQKRSKQELYIVISPKMITSIIRYVFLVNVLTYFKTKLGPPSPNYFANCFSPIVFMNISHDFKHS